MPSGQAGKTNSTASKAKVVKDLLVLAEESTYLPGMFLFPPPPRVVRMRRL